MVLSHLHEACCSAGHMATNKPLTAYDSVFSNCLLTMTLHSQQLWKTGQQPPTEVCCLISVSHVKGLKKDRLDFCAVLMQFSMLVCTFYVVYVTFGRLSSSLSQYIRFSLLRIFFDFVLAVMTSLCY